MSAPIEKVFKTVDGLPISLDIYLPTKATSEKPVPVLIWWHGGGLLQGTRKGTLMWRGGHGIRHSGVYSLSSFISKLPAYTYISFPLSPTSGVAPHLSRAPELHNICVVSADYRLAPQTRLPGILSDVRDAVEYVQSKKFQADTENKVDATKLVVSGSSAGGWLALIAGSQLGFKECNIPPFSGSIAATVPIYPITDITAPFWNTKQHPVTYMNGRIIDGEKELGQYLDPKAAETAFSSLDSSRSLFYHYMIQEALLPGLLLDGTGLSPDLFSVAPALKAGSISMPPTLMTHGTIDDKVPISQAEEVLEALQARGIDADLVREEGKDHLYDRSSEEEMKEMYAFIKRVTA
jgi:acetyl esterase/lipase